MSIKLNPTKTGVDFQLVISRHPCTGRNVVIINSVELNILLGGRSMNPEIKDAYRHILYCALLELRSGMRSPRWWNISEITAVSRALTRTKALADDFHNLAFFSREDFRGFDESRFWSDLKRSSPESHAKYRRIFDGHLTGQYFVC